MQDEPKFFNQQSAPNDHITIPAINSSYCVQQTKQKRLRDGRLSNTPFDTPAL